MAVRQRIAAHFLSGCTSLLEIGAYQSPIIPYLIHTPEDVTIVDPLLESREAAELAGRPCRVRQVAGSLDKLDLEEWTRKSFGLAFCGMDLSTGDAEPNVWLETVCRFLCLTSHAQPAVLEYPVHWQPSVDLFGLILSVLHPRIEADMRLDLTGCVPEITEDLRSRLQRRLVVLKDMEPVSPGMDLRARVARILYGTQAGEFVLGSAGKTLHPVPGAMDIRSAQVCQQAAQVEWRDHSLHIATPPEAFNYAAVVRIEDEVALRLLQDDPVPAKVVIEISVDIGEIGIVMVQRDWQPIFGERHLQAREGPQTVTIFVPDVRWCMGLLFRNGQTARFSAARVHRVMLLLPE